MMRVSEQIIPFLGEVGQKCLPVQQTVRPKASRFQNHAAPSRLDAMDPPKLNFTASLWWTASNGGPVDRAPTQRAPRDQRP